MGTGESLLKAGSESLSRGKGTHLLRKAQANTLEGHGEFCMSGERSLL